MSDELEGRTVVDGDEIDMRKAPRYESAGGWRALCMQDPFVILTVTGMQHGEDGDYMVESILSDGSPGERHVVPAKRFSTLFRPFLRRAEAPCELGEFGADRKMISIPVELWGDTLPIDDVLVAADDEVA